MFVVGSLEIVPGWVIWLDVLEENCCIMGSDDKQKEMASWCFKTAEKMMT